MSFDAWSGGPSDTDTSHGRSSEEEETTTKAKPEPSAQNDEKEEHKYPSYNSQRAEIPLHQQRGKNSRTNPSSEDR